MRPCPLGVRLAQGEEEPAGRTKGGGKHEAWAALRRRLPPSTPHRWRAAVRKGKARAIGQATGIRGISTA